MFGIDFSELVVIMVVALIVIGPEHLPKVARTAGHLWGRAQRYVNGIKSDIARDMEIEELRQLREKVQQEASGIEQTVKQAGQNMEQQIKAGVQPVHEIIEQGARELQGATGQKITPETSKPDQKKSSDN